MRRICLRNIWVLRNRCSGLVLYLIKKRIEACLSINRVEKNTNYSQFIENTLPNEKLIIEQDYSKSTVVDENYIITIVCEKLQKIDFSPIIHYK